MWAYFSDRQTNISALELCKAGWTDFLSIIAAFIYLGQLHVPTKPIKW